MFSPKKIITWFLIALLSFGEIFRVPLILPSARAFEAQNYENIVSLMVEETLMNSLSDEIKNYAQRIQSQLSRTRAVIFTYPRDVSPRMIAATNERLYFSGLPDHGEKTQKLVGTILIGQLPLPVVHRDNQSFLSLFPYTDFLEPHFVWDTDHQEYVYQDIARTDLRPEVWHSVIDPHTGDDVLDATKIRDFLSRVDDFDARRGIYADLGKDPQVLYMDSIHESDASSPGLLSIYEQLFLPNQRHFVMHRYTREFAQYIYDQFLILMKNRGTTTIPSFTEWKLSDATNNLGFLSTASDISTKIFADELVTPFVRIINEKYLGDVQRWIHNTGRYYDGYSDVRADTLPEIITQKDALAAQIIKQSNRMIQKIIDDYVDKNMAMDVPVLVKQEKQITLPETESYKDEKGLTRTRKKDHVYDFVYDNYFYGTRASDLKSARDCSLIRGSTFGGRSTLTEMNHAYNILGAQGDSQTLSKDTESGLNCTPPTLSYWGGNSSLNTRFSNGVPNLLSHRNDDFIQPILDLAGGKRTTASSNGPTQCLQSDLILQPYKHTSFEGKNYFWPLETGGEKYSCITDFNTQTGAPFRLEPSPEDTDNILTQITACDISDGPITLLGRDGAKLTQCSTAQDDTKTYKLISSLVPHIDPTNATYGAQLKSLATPHLPVDEKPFLLYLSRQGKDARIDYPDLSRLVIAPTDGRDAIAKKLKDFISSSVSSLQPGTNFPVGHRYKKFTHGSGSAPDIIATIQKNTPIYAGLIDALVWQSLDIETKYKRGLELALNTQSSADNPLLLPDKKNIYEISYLGGSGDANNFVFGFSPDQKNQTPDWYNQIESFQNAYESSAHESSDGEGSPYVLSRQEKNRLLGGKGPLSSNSGTQGPCNDDPSGVVIWDWPAAIQCWADNLLKTEWEPALLRDFGFSSGSASLSFGSKVLWSTKPQKEVSQRDSNKNGVLDFVEKNNSTMTLATTLSDTSVRSKQTIRIDSFLEDKTFLIKDSASRTDLVVTRIEDQETGKTYLPTDPDWSTVLPRYLTITGSRQLTDGHGIWIISAVTNHRTKVSFETRIFSPENVYIRSQKSSLLLNPAEIGLSVSSSPNTSGPSVVTAGDPQGLVIVLPSALQQNTSAHIRIDDSLSGVQVGLFRAVPLIKNTLHIGSPAIDTILRKTGRYNVTIEMDDTIGKTSFTVVPSSPRQILVTLPKLLLKDIPYTLTPQLVDEYNNSIDLSKGSLEITTNLPVIIPSFGSEPSTKFDGKVTNTLTIIPTVSGSLSISIKYILSDTSFTSSLSRTVLSDIKIVSDIGSSQALVVGQKVPVSLSVQRNDGTIVSDWDLPLDISLQGSEARLADTTLTFVSGRAQTQLFTGTRPGTAYFILPGLNRATFIGNSFEILPGLPDRLILQAPPRVPSRTDNPAQLVAHVYDIFGNPTTLGEYTIHAEPHVSNIITPLSPFTIRDTGDYQANFLTQGLSGRVLWHAWLQKDAKKSSIKSHEDVAFTDILPTLTARDVEQNGWNSLTQVLLGGPFGQTPSVGYFGGSILFGSSHTLALSTLVDTRRESVFTVDNHGAVTLGNLRYSDNLSVSVDHSVRSGISLIVSDGRSGDIARINYPAISGDFAPRCEYPISDSRCDRNTLDFSPLETGISVTDGRIMRNGATLLTLSEVFATPGIDLTFDRDDTDSLSFLVSYLGKRLGTLSVRWSSRVPVFGSVSPTTYSIIPLRTSFSGRPAWIQSSSADAQGMTVSDSLAEDFVAHDSTEPTQGWSSYPSTTGLGWTDKNVSLLTFASGSDWSDAQRDFIDYTSINLGDPLIRLPEYKTHPVTGLDRTIGVPVFRSQEPFSDFIFKDINNDTKADILPLYDNGSVGTSLSIGDGSYQSLGNVFGSKKAVPDTVRMGDFFGDGFADVVYVDHEGSLHLASHDALGLQEKDIVYNVIPTLGPISQVEVFDMDHDSFDDIILLDTLGSLTIFYGSSSGVFTYQPLDHVFDFSFSSSAEPAYFTGSVHYNGPGFSIPKSRTTDTLELATKRAQISQILFTEIELSNNQSNIAGEVNLPVKFDTLNAAFIDPRNLLVTKKYTAVDSTSAITNGSEVRVDIFIKNTSSQPVSDIVLREKIAPYLEVSTDTSTVTIGTKTSDQKALISDEAQEALYDLRSYSLQPGSEMTISYSGNLRPFSFGKFDVGYLEDAADSSTGPAVTREFIKSMNPAALQIDSMSQKDFYDRDVYGDIRFNPNGTCGGPLLLWRSHNAYNRTYHKTLVIKDVADPTRATITTAPDAAKISQSYGYDPNDYDSILARSQKNLDTLSKDTDGDAIPDGSDDEYGDIFTLSQDGGNTTVTLGLGAYEKTVDDISQGVKEVLTGLSCGFGDPGCIAMPINWAANIPGNTVTAMGFAVPGANQPPIACFDDVRCGYPTFSYPTDCCKSAATWDTVRCFFGASNSCTWPSAYGGAGGGFDYNSGKSGSGQSYAKTGVNGGSFIGGDGTSTFRLFTGATLTGAVANVSCFGQNTKDNVSIGVPGLYPIVFEGNCIFATAPITQCSDDGAGDTPMIMETDISTALAGDLSDHNKNLDGNSYINADACQFFESHDDYPDNLGSLAGVYMNRSDSASLDALYATLQKYPDVGNGTYSDSALRIATSSPDNRYAQLDGTHNINYQSTGSGQGIINIALDTSELKFAQFGKVFDIKLKSISGFPSFLMDWYHRQLDEIVASLGHLPDIKIFLPDLSRLTDAGWINTFGSGIKQSGSDLFSLKKTPTQSSLQSNAIVASTPETTPTTQNSTLDNIQQISTTAQKGWNTTFDYAKTGTQYTGNLLSTGLGYGDDARDFVVGGVRQKTAAIQNIFEYIGSLPIIDVEPRTISFDLPWVSREDAQSWIARNQAILDAWKNLPSDAKNSIGYEAMVTSIQSNIETVRSYLELPSRLQNLFYLKEKLLYGFLQNVEAVKGLLGGWLYDNGLRFRSWVETFILVTKLWDAWQILIDIFTDYEVECGTCHNERWNLQQWLWIIISAVVPPIPVIEMPKWPDIELDFSDINLSLNLAYPIFDFSFYPVALPDAPLPSVQGFDLPPMDQLPRLPDLNLDFDIPTIQLPRLPNLPPPPKIPELSQSLQGVIKIFQLVTTIQCLYRKIPLSPEWFIGTKVAHKTERQGYQPFDFLFAKLPQVSTEWVDAIRVSTHVDLTYDVDVIVDTIASALQPFADFKQNLSDVSSSATIQINLNPSQNTTKSPSANTQSSLQQLPTLIGQLFTPSSLIDIDVAQKKFQDIIPNLDISEKQRARLLNIFSAENNLSETNTINTNSNPGIQKINLLSQAIQDDIKNNKNLITHLGDWSAGIKKPQDIPMLADRIPGSIHLVREVVPVVDSPLLTDFRSEITSLPLSIQSNTDIPTSPPPASSRPKNTPSLDTSTLKKTQGLYVTRGSTNQRLIDYTQGLDDSIRIREYDDDNDGDLDVFYSRENVIYRKENRMQKHTIFTISDTPQVFLYDDVLSDFFGIDGVQSPLYFSGDSHIDIHRNDALGSVDYTFLQSSPDHLRLFLFSSINQSQSRDARYITDIYPQNTTGPLSSRPTIASFEGTVFIDHLSPYRILIPGQKFIDATGSIQPLSPDFVIRAYRDAYAREDTTFRATSHDGVVTDVSMDTGQRVVFPDDSRVSVLRGSLILLSTTRERRALTVRDTATPLLAGDTLTLADNAHAIVSFPDGTQTRLDPGVTWSLTEYTPSTDTPQKFSLPVNPDWYYASLRNASTPDGTRASYQTLFDTLGDTSPDTLVSQIPSTIEIAMDTATEIDFQKYFPSQIIARVVLLGLPKNVFRQTSPTRAVFGIQKNTLPFEVKVTTQQGTIATYSTQLVTRPPQMTISDVNRDGSVSGLITSGTTFPLSIQSFIDSKLWPLAGANMSGDTFTAQISPDAGFDIAINTIPLATIQRNTALPTLSTATTIAPRVSLGRPLGISYIYENKEMFRSSFQTSKMHYAHAQSLTDIPPQSGLYIIGPDISLEPATLSDSLLPGGAYLVDRDFYPLISFDAQGIVRTLDQNISFEVSIVPQGTVFTIFRDRRNLGQIVVHGEMIATWSR